MKIKIKFIRESGKPLNNQTTEYKTRLELPTEEEIDMLIDVAKLRAKIHGWRILDAIPCKGEILIWVE